MRALGRVIMPLRISTLEAILLALMLPRVVIGSDKQIRQNTVNPGRKFAPFVILNGPSVAVIICIVVQGDAVRYSKTL